MDAVSRQGRAAEQGFNTPLFHGTQAPPANIITRAERSLSGQEFNQFNWGTHAGTRQAAEDRIRSTDLGGGVPPNFGDLGAIDAFSPGVPRMFPIQVRGKFLEINDLGATWSPANLLEEMRRVGAITAEEAGTVITRAADAERAGANFLEAGRTGVTALMKSKGFAGFKYLNNVEDVGSTSFMILNPANIRSTFAAFDPRNLGLPGMMGSGAGAALFGAGALGRARAEER